MVGPGGLDHPEAHQEVRQELEADLGDARLQERQADQRALYQQTGPEDQEGGLVVGGRQEDFGAVQ